MGLRKSTGLVVKLMSRPRRSRDPGTKRSVLLRMARHAAIFTQSSASSLRVALLSVFLAVTLTVLTIRAPSASDYRHPDLIACFEEAPTVRTRAIWAERRGDHRDLAVTITVGPVLIFYRDWADELVAQATVIDLAVATEADVAKLLELTVAIEEIIARLVTEYGWRRSCSVNRQTQADYRIWQAVDALVGDVEVGWVGSRTVGRDVPKN